MADAQTFTLPCTGDETGIDDDEEEDEDEG